MTPFDRFPSIAYLEHRARRRLPHFAWEYLASGTGSERLVERNRAAMDAIELQPRVLAGRFTPDTSTTLFGRTFSVPFGAAPVGLSGLMWPGAEKILARTAQTRGMPYTLSMMANETPETIAAIAGANCWFQLYPPSDPKLQADILARLRASGIETLVLTVDVPINSRRERQVRAGLSVPPKATPLTLLRIVKRPAWALATLRYGPPRFRTLERYFEASSLTEAARLVSTVVDGRPDWEAFARLREAWPRTLVIKGLLRPEDAARAVEAGVDGIVVSNHGGRQFDGAPAAIDALPAIADAVDGRAAVLFDSGIREGLDIVRALSRGADFCLLGRAFLFAVAALGARGGDHAYEILRADLECNMTQLGARTLADLQPGRRASTPRAPAKAATAIEVGA